MIYVSCAYCYNLYGYLDNATLVNIQVSSIVHYYILFYIYSKTTQPWHLKWHYTYFLVFHQTFKHIHHYETYIKYLYHIQY